VVVVQTKINRFLLVVTICLFASCSDKGSEDTGGNDVDLDRGVEANTAVETESDEPSATVIPDVSNLNASPPEFGALPTSSYGAAFEYIDDASKTLRDLPWAEFRNAANYLLDQRADLLSYRNLGNLTVAGKITDTLTVELAKRVAKGESDTDEVRSVLQAYQERPYDANKLADALEKEHGTAVDLSGSEMARYKRIYAYAIEASGGEGGLFEDVGDSFDPAWFIDGKRSAISLMHIYESHKRTRALDALLKYISRGGDLALNASEFRKSIYEIVPESFEEDALPEFNGTGNLTKLHPANVYRLIPKD